MSTKSILALFAAASCTACASATPLPSAAPAPAPAARELPAPAANAPTAAQPAGPQATIAGTVATRPWHAIKNGAVVYIEDAPAAGPPPVSATMDNHDMTFVPMIAVLPAGGSVIFTNTDPLMHNVFTPDNDKWNLGEIPQNGSVVKRFDQAGAYTILCNLHPHMIGYIVVTPSTYFARTDAEGEYTIRNVPPGTYRLTAWAPRLKPMTQQVTVSGGEVSVNFDLGR